METNQINYTHLSATSSLQRSQSEKPSSKICLVKTGTCREGQENFSHEVEGHYFVIYGFQLQSKTQKDLWNQKLANHFDKPFYFGIGCFVFFLSSLQPACIAACLTAWRLVYSQTSYPKGSKQAFI